MKKIIILLALALLLTGCSRPSAREEEPVAEEQATAETAQVRLDTSELFTDRDYNSEYTNAQTIDLDQREGTVTIDREGSYLLTGTLDDGMILVDVDKEEKVQLVLDNASVTSSACAPIYIRQADKVFLTLVGENTLTNGGSFTAIDENNIDAVIFSKEDLTLNGSGSLTVLSPAGHGIVSKDELTVTGGSYQITAASHGITGKDNVCIDGGELALTTGKDGIHSENDEDESLGYVYIAGGSFVIDAQGDGISAASALQIAGGDFEITTGGGSENAQTKVSGDWGRMPGGGGQPGSFDTMTETEADSESIKGLKGATVTITGGNFTLDTADDAVHGNGNVTVNGGSFTVAAGDDAFHADETLAVTGGEIRICESYEGLEGLCVDISGGDITIVSSDDGINAAGGTDQSGFGGPRGQDRFAGSSDCHVIIRGGRIYINASGDGIDANGSLTISGGHTTVCGPTQGDTAVLDYDSSAVISGGTFVGTGAYMMAQTFSDSVDQGVIAVSVGNCPGGTQITVTDKDGNVVLSAEPELDFMIAILSCPEMIKGQTYTLQVGTAAQDFTAQ